MTAYYNEFDPDKAAWLRELIAQGAIAAGDVDERDIRDVRPADLAGYTQCHFFAGIGVWSYALRLAGWTDDRPVWTASCPCQPFSQAGIGAGFADERHLWPAAFHLVRVGRPDVVLGEQVASSDGLEWLDLVHSDLEGEAYAIGAADLCSAGLGAPNIRQRLFWMAYAASGTGGTGLRDCGQGEVGRVEPSDRGAARILADAEILGRATGRTGEESRRPEIQPDGHGHVGGLDHAKRLGRRAGRDHHSEHDGLVTGTASAARPLGNAGRKGLPARKRKAVLGAGWWEERRAALQSGRSPGGLPGPVNGFWRGAEWIPCRDGRLRPVEPGVSPLASGAAARVVRLRGYGDAINAEVAAEFIRQAAGILRDRGVIQ